MKINRDKITLLYTHIYGETLIEYGCTQGDRAFVAVDGERISKAEAILLSNAPRYYIDYPLRTLVFSWLIPHWNA